MSLGNWFKNTRTYSVKYIKIMSGSPPSKRRKLELPKSNSQKITTETIYSNFVEALTTNVGKPLEAYTLDEKILRSQIKLTETLSKLNFVTPPVKYVYSPLEYAFLPNENYIRKYCVTSKKVIFVGMNPGPFGMCQTGVPFGDPTFVKQWLKIEGEVYQPPKLCPSRPILGLNSPRTEQSGHRLWGYFKEMFGVPEKLFENSFVFNFCPIAFMDKDGCNVTPNAIQDLELRKKLEEACKAWFLDIINLLNPKIIIPIGVYIDKLIKELFKANKVDIKVVCMPHPSPMAGSKEKWIEKTDLVFRTHNLKKYF